MKKTTVLLPLFAAATLSLGACAKQDDTANALATENVTLSAEGVAKDNLTVTDGNLIGPDAGTLDNEAGGLDANATATNAL